MEGKRLHLRPKPFLLTAAILFVGGSGCIALLLGNDPLFRENVLFLWAICPLAMALAAVAGAFIVCGLAETVRGLRSGRLQAGDFTLPAVFLFFLVALLLGEALFPKVARGVEGGLLLLALAMDLWHRRRSAKAGQAPSSSPSRSQSLAD